MSHKPSGLWCDICQNPILEGEWWHIGLTDKMTGVQRVGHGCEKCKKKLDEKQPQKGGTDE